MDRIRVGLTGLAAVFLITLGAAFAFGSQGRQSGQPESKAGEPLAQLGVAPGADKDAAPRASAGQPPDEQAGNEPADNHRGSTGTVTVPAPFNTPAADALSVPHGGQTGGPHQITRRV